MAPATVVGLMLFVIFVSPGLLFDQLAARRRTAESESTFREAGRVLLTGLIFSVLAAVAVSLVRLVQPSWLPEPRFLLGRDAMEYVSYHYAAVVLALLMQVSLSLLFAVIAHYALVARYGAPIKTSLSAWTKAFRVDCPRGSAPYVHVVLKSGMVYAGRVADYSTNLDIEDRQLTLAPPLAFAATSQEKPAELGEGWGRAVLLGAEIEAMKVRYVAISQSDIDA